MMRYSKRRLTVFERGFTQLMKRVVTTSDMPGRRKSRKAWGSELRASKAATCSHKVTLDNKNGISHNNTERAGVSTGRHHPPPRNGVSCE